MQTIANLSWNYFFGEELITHVFGGQLPRFRPVLGNGPVRIAQKRGGFCGVVALFLGLQVVHKQVLPAICSRIAACRIRTAARAYPAGRNGTVAGSSGHSGPCEATDWSLLLAFP